MTYLSVYDHYWYSFELVNRIGMRKFGTGFWFLMC